MPKQESKKHTTVARDASSNGPKKKRAPVSVTCTARKRNGKPCRLPPIRGGTVCHKHGGSAPQVKAKAAERLEAARQEMLDLLEPLLARLRDMAADPTTTDTDVIRVFREIANRVGLSERHVIVPGPESPWDRITGSDSPAFRIERGVSNVIGSTDREALPSGGGEDDELDQALDDLLDARDRARAQEAATRIDHGAHEVVEGRVVDGPEPDSDLFGYPKSRAQKLAESGRPSEHDPEPHRPDGEPFADYERRVREGVEGRE